MFKIGDEVLIYQDPVTEKMLEGVAILVNPVFNQNGVGLRNTPITSDTRLETWWVRFDDDDYSEDVFMRSILARAPFTD